MQRIMEASLLSQSPLTKLRVSALDIMFFDHLNWQKGFEQCLPNLVSLKMTLHNHGYNGWWSTSDRSILSAKARFSTSHFKQFLVGLKSLQSLSLDFPTSTRLRQDHPAGIPTIAYVRTANMPTIPQIGAVMPLDHNWPSLRKLSLQNIACSVSDLSLLLQNQSSALKALYLGSIQLHNGTEPLSQSVRDLGKVLMLGKAAIGGLWLYNFTHLGAFATDMNGNMNPNMDPPVGEAYAECLVDGGKLGSAALRYEEHTVFRAVDLRGNFV
ncbi:hypothetical protein P154DRAFT_581295 [Amniculicola lignicola CBS 123094]|uniref:Uncharacterized protein n=1 Tax=Amniculicola lignicola CBS 123094 TaxID=1392246 RepID=A0A6A5VZU6_9PLEO|nr:hypothetical protein P154DRAFT_581295 [Amniculicola lignicola CBS 123094]